MRSLGVLALCVVALAACACSRAEARREGAAAEVWDLTGAHTRLVWVQGDGTDPFAQGDGLLLMGLDTNDGRGERPILSKPQNVAKPLFTPRGDRIVFSSRRGPEMFVVDWRGSNLRSLGPGYALSVWSGPDGREWVYAAEEPRKETYARVTRFPLDRPDQRELVWDRTPISEDTFQVSEDGRLAGGLFPWPEAGVADLPNRGWRRLGEGCWTALATGDRRMFWYFDGAHRNLTLVDLDTSERWRVPINQAPNFQGGEVYHPRWARDPRYLVITGPYVIGGERDNKVRSGGRQVEVYLGRFNASFSAVGAWARVTRNNAGEMYPDVWIDGGQVRRAPPARTPSPSPPSSPERGAARSPAAPAAGPGASSLRLVLDVRLVQAGAIPPPRSIAPYRQALVVNRYEVVTVVSGTYTAREILIAQWAIRDGRVVESARKTPGTVFRLTVEPYDAHAELEGERLIMSEESPLPLYYDISVQS